ncbi:hypothetical protein GCM10010274_48690 [Streptomyces lavendofoliae]|uniref:Uncharacterized protein n=1 Tax=Streptomyces lavendofoliae TaxID=67314 RepID=A0A918M5T8_9ACTN|nr:hypothetical protein GCM10010274_48690 [Streptomyces lavendofoliae]
MARSGEPGREEISLCMGPVCMTSPHRPQKAEIGPYRQVSVRVIAGSRTSGKVRAGILPKPA